MEFRTLRYFLAVANLGNLSRAAEATHTTQPNLTRQIKSLEEELGQELFIRSRGMALTAAGDLLLKRASQIEDLYEAAEEESRSYGKGEKIAGTVRIAAGESISLTSIAKAMARLRKKQPLIRFEIRSADTKEVAEYLSRGLVDFGVLVEPAVLAEYHFRRLPSYDRWGILCLKDDSLVKEGRATPDNLRSRPIIHSRHAGYSKIIDQWIGGTLKAETVATYNLIYNASLLVKERIGVAFTLEGLIATGPDSPFAFVPLDPPLHSRLDLVYRKSLPLSEAAKAFLEACEEVFAEEEK